MLRRLLADSAVYTVAAVIPGIAGLLLLPIYTRFLRPEDYGLVDLVTLGYSVLTVVGTLEISQGLARYLPEADNADARRQLSSTAFSFTAASMVAVVTIALLGASVIAAVWLQKPETADLWRTGCAAAFFGALQGIALRQLRGSFRPRAYFLVTLLSTVLTALTTLALLHFGGIGPRALLLGQAAGSTLVILLTWILVRGELAWIWDPAAAKKMLRFSLPLLASTLGVIAAGQATRLIVAHGGSLEAAGHFGVAARIASLIGFAASGLQLSLSPLIYASVREPGTPEALEKSFRVFAAGGLVLWTGLTLFAPEIVHWVAAPEFAPSAELVGPIAAAVMITTATMFAPGLEITHSTARVAAVSLFSGGLNLLLGWWWVTTVGITGAGAAMCVSAGIQFLLIFHQSQRRFYVPHHWVHLTIAASVAALVSSPGWLPALTAHPFRWPLRFALLATALVSSWFLLVHPLLNRRDKPTSL